MYMSRIFNGPGKIPYFLTNWVFCRWILSGRNLWLLGENRTMALVFRLHTTNLSQVLDRILFGPKDSLANEPEFVSVPGQTWKIIHLYGQTATWFTIRPVFAKRDCHRTLRRHYSGSNLMRKPGPKCRIERIVGSQHLSCRIIQAPASVKI
jgi:hypothetical protein